MTLSRIAQIAFAATLLGSVQPSRATPLTYDSYSVLNNQTVRLLDPALGFNETAGSGQITLHGGNVPGGLLAMWCIDIPDWLQQPGSFASTGVAGGAFGSKLNALLSHASQFLPTTYDASSALQIAIWKVEYGTGLSVTTPYSSTILPLADAWVANVSGANPLWKADPGMQVTTLLANGRNQDQAFLSAVPSVGPTAVPEPVSILVLGAGLLGLGFMQRNRTRPLSDPAA